MKKLLLVIFLHVITLPFIFAQLSGLKTVGDGGDYATLTDAVEDVNTNGLNGNTVFEIKDGYDRVEAVTIHTYPGNHQYALTIRPETEATEVNLRSSTPYIIQLDSTNNVIIDGRPGGIADSCALKLLHSNKENSSSIWVHDSKNTIIRYCYVRHDGTRGIDIIDCDSVVVEHCDIATNTTGPISNGSTLGIATSDNVNIIIRNNFIHDLHVDLVNNIYGILIENYGIGMSRDSVYNNFITLNTESIDSSAMLRGIRIYGDENINTYVYFNSIYIGGDHIKSNHSYCYNFEVAGTLNILNNILINKRSNGTGNGTHYAIKINEFGTPTINSDHNVVVSDGIGGVAGSYNDIDDITLAQWQTHTGWDLNSVSKGVEFEEIETGDLHLAGTSLTDTDLYGIFLAGIPDIDGEERWADSTFMGADQPSVIEPCIPDPENDPENSIENGNFGDCTLDPWYLYYADYLGVNANADLVDGECTLSGITIATEPETWHIQFNQSLSASQLDKLEKGCRYELSFDARAETDNRQCRVVFQQEVDPWNNVLAETFIMNTETDSYSYEFVPDTIFSAMNLSFQPGLESASFTIDNVKLKKKTTVVTVPGKIEAEEFNAMSGIQIETTTDDGGGSDIGYIDNGDWMEYAIEVPQSGAYTISYRVAGLYNGYVTFAQNGADLSTLLVPNTGGWQTWTTISTTVNLNEGEQTIRLIAQAGGWNINWWNVEEYVPDALPVADAGVTIMYPNPVSGTLNIITGEGSVIQLYNNLGILVKAVTLTNNRVQLDVSVLPEGLYIAEITNGEQVSIRKVIVR